MHGLRHRQPDTAPQNTHFVVFSDAFDENGRLQSLQTASRFKAGRLKHESVGHQHIVPCVHYATSVLRKQCLISRFIDNNRFSKNLGIVSQETTNHRRPDNQG